MCYLFRKQLLDEHSVCGDTAMIGLLDPVIVEKISTAKISDSRIAIPRSIYTELSWRCLMPQMMVIVPSQKVDNYQGNNELNFVVDASAIYGRNSKTLLVSSKGKFYFRKGDNLSRKDNVIGRVIGQFRNSDITNTTNSYAA